MPERIDKKRQDRVPSDIANKRTSPRYPFSSAVEVIDVEGNTRISGRIADIAKKGCYVDTINPFPEKTAVSLKIQKNSQTFETKAAVVYAQTGMGMGLMFTTADPEQLHMLETWLAELSGENAYDRDPLVAVLQFEDAKAVDQASRTSLSELILLLSRKGVLSEVEGRAILQRLFK